MAIDKLTVTVTKTSDGKHDYVQIISADQFTVNVVLIADQIDVYDARQPATLPPIPCPEKSKGTKVRLDPSPSSSPIKVTGKTLPIHHPKSRKKPNSRKAKTKPHKNAPGYGVGYD